MARQIKSIIAEGNQSAQKHGIAMISPACAICCSC